MRAFSAGILLCLIFAGARRVHADSENLLPLSFTSLNADLKKSLSKMSVREALTPMGCLDGATDKRAVCTLKLGSYMSIMAETKKGGKDIVGLTMICGTDNQTDSLKCLLAYAAGMSLTAPEMKTDTRGKIMKVLLDGLDVGSSTTVQTDERKYTLQKSMGLWFHVYASDAED